MRAPGKIEPKLSIAAVERDTGIGKDTLRVWERRYGFPLPERDAFGERIYSRDQVDKLRLIKRLLDQGLRPSKLVLLPAENLTELLGDEQEAFSRCADLLPLVHVGRCEELRALLAQRLACQGLQRFVTETVAPLGADIGRCWMRGEIGVHEEHVYTETVQNLLRAAIAGLGNAGGSPRVLLTTLPGETHLLGLLMAEVLLVSEGACCVSLGAQTPLPDIVEAAEAGGFQAIGLSFSSAFPARQALEALTELRATLAPSVDIWVGGAGSPPHSKLPPGLRSASDPLAALRAWRAA